MKHWIPGVLVASVLSVALGACKPAAEDAAPNPQATTVDVPVAETPAASATTPAFDIASLPLSDTPLGDFPYIGLPAGYTNERRDSGTRDFTRFPFWVKDQVHWAEGKLYFTNVGAETGKSFSQYEFNRNIEALVAQLGGHKISEGLIPKEVTDTYGDEVKVDLNAGLGDVYNEPATTYAVRRADGNLWIHVVSYSAGAALALLQEQPFQATAQLLPASALKQALGAEGKVALQVNFATDKAEILADSLPQIDQVVQLLKEDVALKLEVNGHTDNSGDAAHNQQLSEARARSVMQALIERGVDVSRLKAAGFGDTQPTTDNDNAAGKAQNRRVELVKI